MGWFSDVANGAMDVGAAATTVAGGALETGGHAIAYGACTVVGEEDAAQDQLDHMNRCAQQVGHGVDALSNTSERWIDLDDSHCPADWIANWMSYCSDDKLLCDLYMPGTHDSISSTGGDFAQCQTWNIDKQLLCGVRVFDFRFKHDGDSLRGCHGIIDMDIGLDEIARSIVAFLDAHPSESLFAMISTKGASEEGGHSRDFLHEVIHQTQELDEIHPNRWNFYPTPWPRLGDVRGQCLVSIGNGWADNTEVQDEWEEGDADCKFDYIFNHCRKEKGHGNMSLNYTSCTGSEGIQYHTPKQMAVMLNQRVHREIEGIWFKTAADISPCVFMMDFPGTGTLQLIITRNGPNVYKAAINADVADDILGAFKEWDKNGDGFITKNELTSVFSSLCPDITEQSVQTMLSAADINKDGKIDYKEFVSWVMDGEGDVEAISRGIASKVDAGMASKVDYDKFMGWPATDSYMSAPNGCSESDFLPALGPEEGYYTDPSVAGGWCRSISTENVDAVRKEYLAGTWCPSEVGATYLPKVKYDKFMGWPATDSLLGAPNGCSAQEFTPTLSPGEGYYDDPSVSGGWCRSISAENVVAARKEYLAGTWNPSETGATYLPKVKHEKLMGWPANGSLMDSSIEKCTGDEFALRLYPGEGYYWDSVFDGGLFSRRIYADNVQAIREAHAAGQWTPSDCGAVYLPKV